MELYNKISDLKKMLDKEKSIIDIKSIQNKIVLDKELVSNIHNSNYDKNNELICKYRHLENEINYIILEINMYLKKELVGGCNESNTR